MAKSSKRALLLSALAIVLCIAMLIGTTYAWFTDTASTGVNKIVSGKLDVVLEMNIGGEWVDANGKTLPFLVAGEIPAEGTEILWEPGCTYRVPELRIRNNGNLSLQAYVYVSGFKASGESDVDLRDVIDWKMSGFDGMLTYPDKDISAIVNPGQSLKFDLEAHMKEEAGNEYQGLSVEGISITVVAKQHTYEKDSIDDQYDKDAVYPVGSASELAAALENAKDGDVVVLADSIEIPADDYNASKRLTIAADNVTIDLNGKELTASNHTVTITGDNVTLKNGKIVATTTYANQTYGSYGIAVSGKNAVIDGVTLLGGISVTGYDAADDSIVYDGVSATITNCHITATNYYTVCAQGQASAIVKNSTLTAENGAAFFWIEKGFTDAYGTVADSSLTYETATVTMIGSKPLYNTSGLAPVASNLVITNY